MIIGINNNIKNMKIKNTIKYILIFLAIILSLISYSYIAEGATILFPFQGGTGKGTATAGDVGKFIQISDDSPLTYSFTEVTSPSIGGSITGGTSGAVLLVGPGSVFAEERDNLFWNFTDNELNIGGALNVIGNITIADSWQLNTTKISSESIGIDKDLVIQSGSLSSTSIKFQGWNGSSWVDNVVFTNPGLVGIGTSSPIAQIDVQNLTNELFYAKRTATFDFVEYRRSAGTWTSITTEAGISYGTVSGDILDAVGDTFVIGKTDKFDSIYIDLGTAISSGATLVWEYSKGSDTWDTLTVTDGTTNLTVDGVVSFTKPVDWATDSQDGSAQLYFVRVRVSAGTFTTEPTVYLVVPNAGDPIGEIYANGGDTTPSFLVSRNGAIAIGYPNTSPTITSPTYRLYVLGGISSSGAFSATTGNFSNTITQSISTTGKALVGGFTGTGGTSTALIPSQNSPIIRLASSAWTGSVANANSWDMYVNPTAAATTSSRLIFKNTAVNGVTLDEELMNIRSNGNVNILGNTYGAEVFTNGVFTGTTGWSVTGDWAYTTSDYTFTYSTGSGTLYQTSANYATPLKANTWYRFSYTAGASAPTGTLAWIGTEITDDPVYFAMSTTEVPVYFKTNSTPGDFTIYTTANTTSGFRLDDVSLKEATGGNLMMTGSLGIGTTTPTNILSLGGNVARTIWMERNSVLNTVGNTLTLQGGGATVAATDKNGGMLVLAPGLSTGTGFSSVRLQRLTRAASTGTADNTLTDAYIIPAEVNISDSVDKDLFEVALSTLTGFGGNIKYSVVATNGTDIQVHSGQVEIAAVNKGGVYTTEIVDESTTDDANANSTGTLTETWSIVNGTNKITIRTNFDSSLTGTVTMKLRYTIINNSGQTITQL